MNEDGTTSSDMKPCPICDKMIKQVARKCRFCGEYLDEELIREARTRSGPSAAERMVLPVGRPFSAIAAGYFGLVSLIPPCSIAAIICGMIALKTLNANPELHGRGRAIFGIIMGVLFTLLYGGLLIFAAFDAL